MPLIPLNESPVFRPEVQLETQAEKEARILESYTAGRVDPTGGAWETMKAAFRMDNSAVSFAYNRTTQTFDELEGYDPYGNPEEIKGYDPMMFVESRSPEQTAYIKQQVDLENEDRRFVESQGVGGWAASMAAGLTDPMTLATMLIPFGAVAKGGSALVTAGKAAAGGALGSGATEWALHQSQMTRTAEESALNIAADSVLSGVLGGGLQMFRNRGEYQAATQPMKDYITSKGKYQSVGAAALEKTTIEEETLLNVKAAKVAGYWSPMMDMMTSPSLAARKVSQTLAENNVIFEKNDAGIATKQAVETNIKRYHGLVYQVGRDSKSMYAAYRARVAEARTKGQVPEDLLAMTPKDSRAAGLQKPLTEREFYEKVTIAMRNGDESMIPEAGALAKQLRPIFDETKRVSIELGIMDEAQANVRTSKTYVHRAYNFAKIREQRGDFRGILVNYFAKIDRAEYYKAQETIEKLKSDGVSDDVFALGGKHEDLIFEKATDTELNEMADAVIDKILGAPNGMVDEAGLIPENIITKAGAFKERTLNIPDADIQDFLENDITYVMNRYIRQVAPDIELTKAFGRKDMADQINEINAEYVELRRQAGDNKSALDKLEKQRKQDIKNLELMRDRLLGTYGAPQDASSKLFKASRTMRQINFLSMLGGMTVSAIPDLARPIMQHGFKNAMSNIVPFARIAWSNSRIRDVFRLAEAGDKKALQAKAELQEVGVAVDYLLSTRAQAISDITADNLEVGPIGRGMEKASNMFGNWSLMNHWNDAMKIWGGLIIQSRIMKAAQTVAAGGKLSKAQRIAMTRTGLDENTLKMIAEQFNKYGEKDGSLFLARSDQWDNIQFADNSTLTERYQNAVLGDVENTIVTPSVGDKPWWFDTNEAAKHITQFKSFFLASSTKMVGNLQQNDAAFYSGVVLSIGLGAMASNIKEILRGKEPDYSVNNQLKEGLDYSGVMGWVAEPIAMADKWSGGRVGMGTLLGVEGQGTRYQSRGTVGALLGPSVSTGENMINIVNGVLGEEWTPNHTRSVRKLIPAQNLFYIRDIINQAEDGVNDMAGIK
ncbi:putative internal virion protein 1 [Vibrio phage CKB-S2]|nr:putative internal virion protein 1 [Vibrio phage CKB-S2]